jgi:hypothetical protein
VEIQSVIRASLVAAGFLLPAGCASQTASTVSLDERYFQQEARHYLKFVHEGRTVYCQNNRSVTSNVPYKQCIWEDALRRQVEDRRRERNQVAYWKR